MSQDLESRVAAIEARNKRVELDKKWETSWTRRLSIVALTYLVVLVYLLAIGNNNPFINAFVPAIGFTLSTSLLRSIRVLWQKENR
ncbi:MAG TPA: hypothetical protein VLE74_01055 [Candidatus Saccharimonadales bacterium]|nr:hypothetical protein [Candidatus Saccharimonadales bacterium]